MADADRIERVARAICAETCAFMGEPPCYEIRDDQNKLYAWPPESCDDPGCMALAAAAVAAMTEAKPEASGSVSAELAAQVRKDYRERPFLFTDPPPPTKPAAPRPGPRKLFSNE